MPLAIHFFRALKKVLKVRLGLGVLSLLLKGRAVSQQRYDCVGMELAQNSRAFFEGFARDRLGVERSADLQQVIGQVVERNQRSAVRVTEGAAAPRQDLAEQVF